MLDKFINSFVNAWGRGLGYQAARKTGWFLVPILVVIVGGMMLAQVAGVDLGDVLHYLPNIRGLPL